MVFHAVHLPYNLRYYYSFFNLFLFLWFDANADADADNTDDGWMVAVMMMVISYSGPPHSDAITVVAVED